MLLMVLFAWLPWLLLGTGALYLGVRAVRALERRAAGGGGGGAGGELAALRDRVQALEAVMEAQADELRRVSEGQQFTERLLAERATGPREGGARDA